MSESLVNKLRASYTVQYKLFIKHFTDAQRVKLFLKIIIYIRKIGNYKNNGSPKCDTMTGYCYYKQATEQHSNYYIFC